MNYSEEESFESASEGGDQVEESPTTPTPTAPGAKYTSSGVKEAPSTGDARSNEPPVPKQSRAKSPSNNEPKDKNTDDKNTEDKKKEESWSGWGSFLSSAVSAVAESLQSEVDAVMHTAKDLTDTVYHTLDQPPNASHPKEGDPEAPEGSPDVIREPVGVLSAIDKTLDFTSDLLGNAVLESYKQLEKAKSHQMVRDGTQVGQKLVQNGLTALEAIGSVVGSKAVEILVADNVRSASNAPVSNTGNDSSKRAPREMNLLDYFEDNCGNAHLQALEMLGTEASLKVSAYSSAERESCVECFDILDDNFNFGDFGDDSKGGADLVSDEGFKEFCRVLERLCVSNLSQAEDLRQFLSTFYATSLPSLSTKSATDDDDSDLKQVRVASMKSVADYLEKSCEQILRLAEILLMQIAEDRLTSSTSSNAAHKNVRERVEKFSEALSELVSILIRELFRLTKSFSDLGDKRSGGAKFQGDLLDDRSNAQSFINEAALSILPIIKLMLISSVSSTSSTQEETVKEESEESVKEVEKGKEGTGGKSKGKSKKKK